uniref:N-methyl-d-aspartate receptor glutamate-binding subunit n=1 Tax=Macrostomum lignano TaxID=282301 RepID=A0A1I8FQQ3_9PLAT
TTIPDRTAAQCPHTTTSRRFSSTNMEFSEESVRKGFVRKVYGLLSLQLGITLAFVALFVFCEPVKEYSKHHPWLYIVAPGRHPGGAGWRAFRSTWCLLLVFTLCESYMLGSISSHFDTGCRLHRGRVTAFVVLALTIFALQTKIDFTMLSGILFVLLIVLLLFGFLCAIIQSRFATLAYSCLGALLFSVYLVVDTQLMLGGKHKYALSPRGVHLGRAHLYLDIINLFLFILAIIQGARD